MTRQEEINKMAKEVATYFASDEDVQAAFRDVLIRGAEWADAHPHWISVDVELPICNEPYFDIDEEVCDDLKCSKKVIVFADNDFHIATLNQNYDDGEKRGKPYWFDEEHSEDGAWLDGKVTHWIPLPQVPILSNSGNIGKDLKGGEE